ncbi:hypothetical protein V1524DRAFT_371902 [Lipomyces starkeyi]
MTVRGANGTPILKGDDIPIYQVRGRIPKFGLFKAEMVCMQLDKLDLILGRDWLDEAGLLNTLIERLGILDRPEGLIPTPKTKIELQEDIDNDDQRQDIIDAMIRTARISVIDGWKPYLLDMEIFAPQKYGDWKMALAAVLNADQSPGVISEGGVELPQVYRDLEDVFRPEKTAGLPRHRPGFDHEFELEPGAVPPNLPQFHMSEFELQVTKDKIEELEGKGFIRRSQSPCGAPIVFAAKINSSNLLSISRN